MTFNSKPFNGFLRLYIFHIEHTIRKHGLPYKKCDWKKTQGALVEAIINQKELRSVLDLVSFFLFLVFNSYILGPKISRDFFVYMYEESPRYSESGRRHWDDLISRCRNIISNKCTYHDIASAKPVPCRLYIFDANVKRILRDQDDVDDDVEK